MKFKFLILISVSIVGSICSCNNTSSETKTTSIYKEVVINYDDNKMYFNLEWEDENVEINLLVSNSSKLYKYDDTSLGLAHDASNLSLLTEGLSVYGYMDFHLKGTEMVQFNFEVSALKLMK